MFHLCKKIYRKKYGELKRRHKELEKRYKELVSMYRALYELYNGQGCPLERLKLHIMRNASNIRNYNSKDRTYNSRKYVCLDGQVVRSKAEREIYNYLILNGVKVRYEAIYKTPWGSIIRPDFYLPDYKIYIEYFGKEKGEDKKYDEIMKFKNELYHSSPIPFIILHSHDDANLYHAIKSKLARYINVSNWI